MAAITYFVALPILAGDDGDLYAGEGIEAQSEREARSRASALAQGHAGAVAFSRSGDPSTGEYEPAVVLASYGDLPSDIADMIGGRP